MEGYFWFGSEGAVSSSPQFDCFIVDGGKVNHILQCIELLRQSMVCCKVQQSWLQQLRQVVHDYKYCKVKDSALMPPVFQVL